ncbi:MAG: aminoacetone oxidase family FAD-binding enzyme [Clostridia bacterium]|nr:aminoacetone oxidase family FAD-binding enzyme [Clostridia bacterium]
MTERQTVAVIGGGAAGLAAAISAAECGDRVIVLERMDRVGKKILATGNGRCNLMNTGAPEYHGDDRFAERVLWLCGAKEQMRFWRAHGLALWEEEAGRVYPVTGQASTVLDTLRFTLEKLGVEIRTGVRVTGLKRTDAGWLVLTEGEAVPCDRVIVAGGGKAQPKLGSDGSTYALLEAHGHRLINPKPALTQIETETDPIRGLSGIRVRAEVTVLRGQRRMRREEGELLFTDYGVSGICAMQCAAYITPAAELSVNLLPGMANENEIENALRHRRNIWRGQPADRLLCGLLVPRLAERVADQAGVKTKDREAEELKNDELHQLACVLRDFRLKPTGIKGFESAQVTAGGIDTEDFSPINLESQLAPGLHAAGEILNVDGDCGGFNLMFAFGSGILAGLNGRKRP